MHVNPAFPHAHTQATPVASFAGPNKLDLHGLSFGAAKLAVKWWIHEAAGSLTGIVLLLLFAYYQHSYCSRCSNSRRMSLIPQYSISINTAASQ